MRLDCKATRFIFGLLVLGFALRPATASELEARIRSGELEVASVDDALAIERRLGPCVAAKRAALPHVRSIEEFVRLCRPALGARFVGSQRRLEPQVSGGWFSSRRVVTGVRQDARRFWTEPAQAYLKELTAFILEAAPAFVKSTSDFEALSELESFCLGPPASGVKEIGVPYVNCLGELMRLIRVRNESWSVPSADGGPSRAEGLAERGLVWSREARLNRRWLSASSADELVKKHLVSCLAPTDRIEQLIELALDFRAFGQRLTATSHRILAAAPALVRTPADLEKFRRGCDAAGMNRFERAEIERRMRL